jgi:hypothetical protein
MTKRIKPFAGRLALAVLGLGAAALSVTVNPASAVSEQVVGKFKTDVLFGEECQAASAKVCAVGKTTGNLSGAFTFGVSSLTPTEDPSPAPIVRFSGDATVETKGGSLHCRNQAALAASPDGPFVSLCIVSGGTGEWAGATGYLQVRGTFSFSGGASGEYVGRLDRS